MNAPFFPPADPIPTGVRAGQWARSLAQAMYDSCPDCGSTAQGTGFFGKPYCGLCERSIPEGIPHLTPITTKVRQLNPELWPHLKDEEA